MIKLARKIARLGVQAFFLPVIALLWLLKPLKSVKFARLSAERIGNLTMVPELFLRDLQLGGKDRGTWYIFICAKPCNKALLGMYRRHLTIIESAPLLKAFDVCKALLDAAALHEPLGYVLHEYKLFDEGRPVLRFTPEQEERGRQGLGAMGIGEKDWFVCFHNRDSAYLKAAVPDADFSYHDYRDCRVENFIEAAQLVVKRGGFALRMGSIVARPLPETGEPRIIDYATRFHDEFMDLYLIAKCRFFIGSDTGLAQVATAFDRPIVNTNVPRIDWAAFRAQDIFIHKKTRSLREGRVLTYAEILERGLSEFGRADQFAAAGLTHEENTPEEIADATHEMLTRLDGTWKADDKAEALQQSYRSLFTPRHFCFGFRSRVGSDFLLKNASALFGKNAPILQTTEPPR